MEVFSRFIAESDTNITICSYLSITFDEDIVRLVSNYYGVDETLITNLLVLREWKGIQDMQIQFKANSALKPLYMLALYLLRNNSEFPK